MYEQLSEMMRISLGLTEGISCKYTVGGIDLIKNTSATRYADCS